MEKEKISHLHNKQLEILLYFDKVCKELNVNYYLVFGTLLGAARHHDSIPWDADIDVAVMREDYERLKKYLASQDRYFLQDYTTYRNHFSPHAILQDKHSHIEYFRSASVKPKYDGVYIDIFPIEEVSSLEKERNKQAKKVMFWRSVIGYKLNRVYENQSTFKILLKKVVAFLLKPISFAALCKKVDKEMKRYNGCRSGLLAVCTDAHAIGCFVKAECFGVPEKLEYAGHKLLVPNQWDEMLTKWYGDYRKLPPEEKRWIFFDTELKDVIYDNE